MWLAVVTCFKTLSKHSLEGRSVAGPQFEPASPQTPPPPATALLPNQTTRYVVTHDGWEDDYEFRVQIERNVTLLYRIMRLSKSKIIMIRFVRSQMRSSVVMNDEGRSPTIDCYVLCGSHASPYQEWESYTENTASDPIRKLSEIRRTFMFFCL
jgi:hypothetical protein